MMMKDEATIVVTFDIAIDPSLVQWIISASSSKAGLKIELLPRESDAEKVILAVVTAPLSTKSRIAEELKLLKQDQNGKHRVFIASQESQFLPRGATSPFTQAEELIVLRHAMEQVKADPDAFDDVRHLESVFTWAKRQEYLKEIFPLHHRESAQDVLKHLSWGRPWFHDDGIVKIRDYFGDKVALYFSFLGFYTRFVILLGFLGLFITAVGVSDVSRFVYCLFVCVWGVTFISMWRRENIELIYKWRHLIVTDPSDEAQVISTLDEQRREEFFGELTTDPVTGKATLEFPAMERAKRLAVSAVACLSILAISVISLKLSLDFQDVNDIWLENNQDSYFLVRLFIMKSVVIPNIPLVLYMGLLYFFDFVYSKVAVLLTEWENHEFDYEFENSLIFKKMNLSYLYLAFIKRDVPRVASGLRLIMVLEVVIGNVKETILPMLLRRRNTKTAKKAESKTSVSIPDQIRTELELETPDELFADYFELLRQFTQITVFATAFPLGAVLAALNNIIEVYADTYKYLHNQKRVFPIRAMRIGAWIYGFEILSILAIVCNLGMLVVERSGATTPFGDPDYVTELLFVFSMEHVLLAVRTAVQVHLGGVPKWILRDRFAEKDNRNGLKLD